ncbi:MAG: glycosyltransferase family 4 protein, partial [Solirubrobacterales bacterium]
GYGGMRILVFHGYLLRGTGSNIYNASLAKALVKLGHEVHLLCQDRQAGELDFVDAVGSWEGGKLKVEQLREPVRCTAYRPDIGEVLPVYVADEYEGFRAVRFADLPDDELDRYLDANVGAVREVAERTGAEVALANHLVMGPVIVARAIGGRVPYAVKVHGSALEYTVRPEPERFLPYAREGLEQAGAVLVGSRHTAESLWEVVGDPGLPDRTRLGPPGVDADSFVPREPEEAARRLTALADRLEGASGGWGGDAGASDALRAMDPRRERIVGYVGKLLVSKGVDLRLSAWPLVWASARDTRLVVVGFGTYREGLDRLIRALAGGDLHDARDVAARGRELEGGPAGELTYLTAFLDDLPPEYADAAADAFDRVHFTGRLEHDDLPDLLPSFLAQVVPSTFPEAFGMVAVEAAACGALPLSAAHSGLAEVTRQLQEAVDEPVRPLLSFDRGPGAVEEIAAKLAEWLSMAPEKRDSARAGLSDEARRRFGWEGVARGVIAAAEGRLDDLPRPGG